jgi:hypothetical protein
VSTPTYTRRGDGTYALNAHGVPGPVDPHALFPEQRTYSEWLHSDFGEAGSCPDGGAPCVPASCQDCHMPGVATKACGSGGPPRSHVPAHAFAGGNTWVLRAIRALCLGEGQPPEGRLALACAGLPADALHSRCSGAEIACTTDAACDGAGRCRGECVAERVCSGDEGCGEGELCVKNAATRAHCAGEGARACTSDAECAGSGPCLGRCGGDDFRCATAADCGGGGECLKGPATFARCAGDALVSCADDGDCAGAGPCLGQCGGAPAPGCTTDGECAAEARCVKDPVRVAELRTEQLLRGGADLVLHQDDEALVVRVVNQAGHKLPTGYPEGRRLWLAARFVDAEGRALSEHGGYDFGAGRFRPTGTCVVKVYEAKHAIDDAVAAASGLDPGTGFHLALSNVVEKDNRIPPRGFRNVAYAAVGAAPAGAAYADGQHWDDTRFPIPAAAVVAEVILYFETTSREYIEFLRDADPNGAAGAGGRAFQQWAQHATPVVVDARRVDLVPVDGAGSGDASVPACRDDSACDDDNPCTDDGCDPCAGCRHVPREGSCDDGDACTSSDACLDGACTGRITDAVGVACRLARLDAAPCGAETIPRKLAKRMGRKVRKALHLLDEAAERAAEGRPGKARALRERAAKRLDAIARQATRAARAAKATKRISPGCRDAIDAIASDGRRLVEGLAP